jgi:hypothetical protein
MFAAANLRGVAAVVDTLLCLRKITLCVRTFTYAIPTESISRQQVRGGAGFENGTTLADVFSVLEGNRLGGWIRPSFREPPGPRFPSVPHVRC